MGIYIRIIHISLLFLIFFGWINIIKAIHYLINSKPNQWHLLFECHYVLFTFTPNKIVIHLLPTFHATFSPILKVYACSYLSIYV